MNVCSNNDCLNPTRGKYCSRSCAARGRVQSSRVCDNEGCSNRTKSQATPYCSRCTGPAHPCLTCGRTITNDKFCDLICSGLSRRLSGCRVCHQPIEYDSEWCSPEHSRIFVERTQKTYPDGYSYVMAQRHPLGQTKYVDLHRLILWQKLRCESLDCEHECEMCGRSLTWGGILGIVSDHIDGNPSNNHPDNLQVLCTGCNLMKGRGHLPLITLGSSQPVPRRTAPGTQR